MEILQLPILALQERIEQEMNENPMLEVEERDEALPDEEAEDYPNPKRFRTEDEKELVVKDGQSNARILSGWPTWTTTCRYVRRFRRSGNRIQEESDRAHD